MTKALIMTLRDWLAEQSDERAHPEDAGRAVTIAESSIPKAKMHGVNRVHLVVGAFTCVEPASLQFAFAAQTQGTFLDGVELVIRETPLIAYCHPCQQEYRPEMGQRYSCPSCQSPMDDIRSGRELKIERVEFSQISVAFSQ